MGNERKIKKPPKTEKPIDARQARERVKNLVLESAEEIAWGAIGAAVTGQLAQMKYLFEFAGIHPATAETVANEGEESLVHTLLRKVGEAAETAVNHNERARTAANVPDGSKDTVE
jgi:hypothetical protein